MLAALGEAVEKTGVLDSLGAEAQTISGDAESMRGLVEAARSKMKSAPEKVGYGQRLGRGPVGPGGEAVRHGRRVLQSGPGRAKDSADPSARPPSTPAKAGPPAEWPATLRPPGAEVLMVWGVGLMMGDRAVEAAKVFQRGIDEKVLPDDNPAFYFYLAGALAMAGRHDEALAAARTAAEKGKDSARFCGRPAWVLYVAKRYGEAIKAYRKLIDEFDADYASTETRDVLREARMALSNLAVIRGDMPQAEEWLEQVLDEFPDDEGALNDLGYLWADQNKNLQRAQRMIRKARRGRAGQPGLSRQSRLGVVPPGEIPRSHRRVGEGRRRRRSPTPRSSTISATPIARRTSATRPWRRGARRSRSFGRRRKWRRRRPWRRKIQIAN